MGIDIVLLIVILVAFASLCSLQLRTGTLGLRRARQASGSGSYRSSACACANTAGVIINPLIKAVKAGIDLTTSMLEQHYRGRQRGPRGRRADRRAESGHTARFKRATAIDLAGRDVLTAVKMSVNPKVIETPIVAAIAKDGIELRAKARVTVRANIDRLVGGAGEETVIARVGEGIVTTVGSSNTHKEVLENPDLISRTVLGKGLDAGTAFEILSIDIADVDVGRNVGAQLQIDQAEADKRIAQAKAEERRAMAVAGQEMLAQSSRCAQSVVSEAEIPLAMASFPPGAPPDYYNMKNVIADATARFISRLRAPKRLRILRTNRHGIYIAHHRCGDHIRHPAAAKNPNPPKGGCAAAHDQIFSALS